MQKKQPTPSALFDRLHGKRYPGGRIAVRHTPSLREVEELEREFGRRLFWYLSICVDEDGELSEEVECLATDKGTARQYLKAVLESDYEPGIRLGKIELA